MNGDTLPAAACLSEAWPSSPKGPVRRALKSPVLGWASLWPGAGASIPSIAQLPHRRTTTSGRAALLAALRELDLPSGSGVLVPTYHCPTMIAPVLKAGLQPVYYPIGDDGLPRLDALDPLLAGREVRAMLVAHYFGLPKDLAALVAWCRARDVAVVEDCAHAYFGMAGERPVGHWGDYATASLSKFFPVPEGGLLASAVRPLPPLGLTAPGLRHELKGVVDVLEHAWQHDRLPGLSHLLAPIWRMRQRAAGGELPIVTPSPGPVEAAELMEGCDMARVGQRPTRTTVWLHRLLPEARIAGRRRTNYQAYSALLGALPGAHGLEPVLPDQAAPYVWPLWIDGEGRAQRAYAAMREQRLPVFRWDRTWPGTPQDPQDRGVAWGRQLIQLLCHQDLHPHDVRRAALSLRSILAAH